MTTWIECNLPYDACRFVDDADLPQRPDVSDQERAQFGKSIQELTDSHGDDKLADLGYRFISISWELSRAETHKEETRIAKEVGMSDVLRTKRQIEKIERWRETSPEYVAWGESYKAEHDRLSKESEGRTFVGQGLAKPGTQIEVDGKLYLIGDINPNRCVCDDCTAFDMDAIVTRYRVLVPLDTNDVAADKPKCAHCDDMGGCSSCNECGLCHACKQYNAHDDTCEYSGSFGPLMMFMDPDEWRGSDSGPKEVTGPGWYWRTAIQWYGPFATRGQAEAAKVVGNGKQS